MQIEPDVNKTNLPTYRTQDRGLAAAFMALGFELVQVAPLDHGPVFLFRVSQDLLDAADAYWIDALAISARRVVIAMEHLNDLVPEPGTPREVDLDAP